MSVISIAELKTKFETGDVPSQQDFIDLIDTLSDDVSAIPIIQAEIGDIAMALDAINGEVV